MSKPVFEKNQLLRVKKDAKYAKKHHYGWTVGKQGRFDRIDEQNSNIVWVEIPDASGSPHSFIWSISIEDIEIVETTNKYYLQYYTEDELSLE